MKCYVFIFRDFFSEYLLFPLVSFWDLEDVDLKSLGLDRYSDRLDPPGETSRAVQRSYVTRLQVKQTDCGTLSNLLNSPCFRFLTCKMGMLMVLPSKIVLRSK